MRRFNSYGPVNPKNHFAVPRKQLVAACVENLIGDPDDGGHYFTLWAPRQTGKTWLMQTAKADIDRCCPDRFVTHGMSFGNFRGMQYTHPDGVELPEVLIDILELELPGHPHVQTWKDFTYLFSTEHGLWRQPLILLIDEVDTTPPPLLDLIVGRFREMYLNRSSNHLHGLALVGVSAVLGVESERGSPFNIQRAIRVPNFTKEEVIELFHQYQEESGQAIEPYVVSKVFEVTQGHPGLVGWFGELLTEKFNVKRNVAIDVTAWENTYRRACTSEWNNTLLNLIKKAKGEHLEPIMDVFTRSDIPFSIDADWCAYAYLNGIIDYATVTLPQGDPIEVCRFSSPFIQHRMFNALTRTIIGERLPIPALEPTDRITDIFEPLEIDLASVITRYKAYLKRLRAAGLNPWKDQPRRKDMHLTEAVGHFHLYAWLQNALGRYCTISPEFPTGNGRVDLHLKCAGRLGIIEVKSFTDLAAMDDVRSQAADYASRLKLPAVTVALFVPTEDENVLNQLSGEAIIEDVRVVVSAIGWM